MGKPRLVAQACDLSTQEGEAGRKGVQGKVGLQCEFKAKQVSQQDYTTCSKTMPHVGDELVNKADVNGCCSGADTGDRKRVSRTLRAIQKAGAGWRECSTYCQA